MIDNNIFRSEEKAIFALRSLYRKYGYLPFKMSKFEEYEFYIQNKDFLVSDRIIAFNDTSGKLLALKPDVTLSIIKNGEDKEGFKQKVCYNENVYRVSENTHQFKEIMQTGIECIGDIDLYDIYEMILLAGKSLSLISDEFVIEVSHIGLISSVLNEISQDEGFKNEILSLIANKNSHDLARVCEEKGVDQKAQSILFNLVAAYGDRNQVINKVQNLLGNPCEKAVEELKALSEMLDSLPFSDKIIFDFSTTNDVNYYNGIVFRGFVSGISQSVLTGGQYDKLLKKLGRKSGAIGFAIYLDLLEQLSDDSGNYDVDVVLLYDSNTDKTVLASCVDSVIENGETVSVQTDICEKLSYKRVVDLRKEG